MSAKHKVNLLKRFDYLWKILALWVCIVGPVMGWAMDWELRSWLGVMIGFPLLIVFLMVLLVLISDWIFGDK